jgi:DNA-binding MarR family transcriptional regulator
MPTTPEPGAPSATHLEHQVFLALARLFRDLSADLAELFRGAGITWTQYNVLRILRGAGGAAGAEGAAGAPGVPGRALSCGEIGERLIARDADVTRLLDRLEKQGLVQRARDEADRRVVVTRPTERGLAVLDELDAPVMAAHRAQLGHLGDAKLRQLLVLLAEAAVRPA